LREVTNLKVDSLKAKLALLQNASSNINDYEEIDSWKMTVENLNFIKINIEDLLQNILNFQIVKFILNKFPIK